MEEKLREKIIVQTSIVGIAANVLLASFKAVAGILSNSIAVVLDAVNNLTDALSSVVTIAGAKLAGRKADKKHPFGYGRAEYLSSLVIAVIILYAGATSLAESVKKIVSPEKADYTAQTLLIISAAVLVKIALGLFVKSRGKSVNSSSLVASGDDALLDSAISASTLAAAAVYIFFGISVESYLGVLISIAILKTGFEILLETLRKILGERTDSELSRELKKTIAQADSEIFGAFDLVLNDYGPDRHLGSVHIEVPETWTADKIDRVSRKISAEVFKKHGVVLAAVGVYSRNTEGETGKMLSEVSKIALSVDGVLQVHGFFVDEAEKTIRFDAVMSFESKIPQEEIAEKIKLEVEKSFPNYKILVQPDVDISD